MKRILLATAIGAVVGYGAAVHLAPVRTAIAEESSVYETIGLFGDIFDRIRVAYVEEVKERDLIEAGINGMLTSLDPHSSYLPPDAFSDMQEQTRGEFGGLGIEVTMEEGFVKVVAPIDDTPAARAGIQAGDFITHLDGESILGLTLNQAVEKMRGPVKSDITLTVVREGADEPFDVVITRDVIKIYPVRVRVEGDVGYLRVTTFNQQTGDDLIRKIKEVTAEIGEDKVRGFVLDLRNNPGGLLSQAVAVADAFLDKGEIVSTRGRDRRSAERYNATAGDLTGGKPVVVLINGGSASASEIVAGALQDHRRAIVIGAKSFGKGSVQTIIRLANGGAMRLTTSRYYTPSGRSIQALGIEPDIRVDQLKVEAPEAESERPARTEESLRGRLDAETSSDDTTDDEKKEAIAKRREELRVSDYQLAYALDLLDGLSAISALDAD